MNYQGLRLENDTWWWEKVRLDELGLPESWNFVVPDKLTHFLTVFCLGWLLFALCRGTWVNRHWSALIAWVIMMGPWELVWDGMFRQGFSVRDAIANTLGGLLFWWWAASYDHVGQSQL